MIITTGDAEGRPHTDLAAALTGHAAIVAAITAHAEEAHARLQADREQADATRMGRGDMAG